MIPIWPQNESQIVAESCMTSIEESTCVLWASPLIVLTGEKYAVGRECFEIVSILSIHTMVQFLYYFYRHTSAGGCEQNTVSIGVARVGSTSQPSQADTFEHANMAGRLAVRRRHVDLFNLLNLHVCIHTV